MQNARLFPQSGAPNPNREGSSLMADTTLGDAPHDFKLYVYVIESEAGPLKIGFSCDPQARLLSLMTGHPFALEVVYTAHHAQAPLVERLDNCR